MTSSAVRARATPGRTAAPLGIDALLIVDLDHRHAHYECYRPGCPKPLEEPIKPSATTAFIGGIKARHLGQYHGEKR